MTGASEDDPFRDVIEHPFGGVLFPGKLARKGSDGVVVETKIRIRIPRPDDMTDAHVKAVVWFRSFKDPQGNPVLDRKLDAEQFEHLKQLCILAVSIRDWESLSQFCSAEELAKYDETSLQAIQEQINVYKIVLDHRAEDMSDSDYWRTLLQMNRGKTIVPLGGMAGPAQYSFMLRTVSLAASSPEALSWLRASESSTPAP
jgi:hypothetical protein